MIKSLYRFLHPRFQNFYSEYKVNLRPRYGHGNPPHPELYKIIEESTNSYIELLGQALKYKDYLWDIPLREKDESPYWLNGYLPGLDVIMLYSVVAEQNPATYVEIGSGHSTRIVAKAIVNHNLQTKIISVDPMARTTIHLAAHEIVQQPLEELNWDWGDKLKEGDILFIDNSHRILPNSDATVFFMEILPRLTKGVLVHIHDVYLPFDYPPFMCERFYSEQYGLAINLLANPQRYRPILSNYFISEDAELSSILDPIWSNTILDPVERHGGSFWLRVG